MSLLLVIIVLMIIVGGMEACLWMLFRRKIIGLSFPRGTDHSALPFFTIQGLRMLAFIHTLVLAGIMLLFLTFLW